MKYYRFLQTSSAEVPEWLEERTDFFILADDEGASWLYLPLASTQEAQRLVETIPFFSKFEEMDINDNVDWGVQWSTHSPDFKDYQLQVDLSKYTSLSEPVPTLYLDAGPGFGDLSHPTTRLTLAMMASHVKGKDVVDIGCGSGILTLAALLLGANSACGIDIDPEALAHAKGNAVLNGLEVVFQKPEDFSAIPSANTVILMNMIRSQQEAAWASLPQLHGKSLLCFTSGVLASEKEVYRRECLARGWQLIQEQQQGDWMGFQWRT